MTSDKVTPDHLRRRAIVYVRQSTVIQVLHNLESQRRQYNLVEYARELGFTDVVTIDEDLGKSGSGLVERPGFQRLVAEVCAGQVGGRAVYRSFPAGAEWSGLASSDRVVRSCGGSRHRSGRNLRSACAE
jgi:hypothetical protein